MLGLGRGRELALSSVNSGLDTKCQMGQEWVDGEALEGCGPLASSGRSTRGSGGLIPPGPVSGRNRDRARPGVALGSGTGNGHLEREAEGALGFQG